MTFKRFGNLRRPGVPAVHGLLLAAVLLASAGSALVFADGPDVTSAYVARVEEDWILLVNQPDAERSSPQVSTQMAGSPDAARFCNFHLNSCDIPTFSQGGLQLQVWHGDDNLAVFTSASRAAMNTADELVTWTQYLSRESGELKFGISAASSQTWGDFSGMEVAVPGGSPVLDYYSAEYSLQNSGVTFGANRVSSMVLVATRVYYSDGSVQTDNTPRIVYSAVLDPALGGE